MGLSHYEVAKAFADRKPFSKRGRPLAAGNVYISSDGKNIYSYGKHFSMAHVNDEKKIFIINGDTYSHTTARHQGSVRAAIHSNTAYNSVILPFSVLPLANINSFDDISIIDEGREIDRFRCDTCERDLLESEFVEHNIAGYREINIAPEKYGYGFSPWGRNRGQPIYCDGKKHKTWHRHLLAPSLIGYRGRYFLSAFDETARLWNGGYFFSELPRKAITIDNAFAMLAPDVVKRAQENGVKVKRQGDIFAIETDLTTRRLNKKGTKLPIYHVEEKVTLDWNNNPFHTEQIKTDRLEDASSAVYVLGANRPRLLGTNHAATEAIIVKERGKDVLYARGTLYHRPNRWNREPDHRNITLGKKWHRIYRNTALNSWGVVGGYGRVD